MTGEYEDDDSLYLHLSFKVEGLFLEAAYMIDLNISDISFVMDKPLIVKNEFIITAEFDKYLKERIKGINRDLESFNDERLDRAMESPADAESAPRISYPRFLY